MMQIPSRRISFTLDFPSKQIKALAKFKDIGGVFLKDQSAVPDLANSMAISRANQAHAAPLGYNGERCECCCV